MARFRFQTEDILSPLNSDISLNTSRFSFGNLSGSPDCDKDVESPIHKYLKKDSGIDFISVGRMQEDANPLESVVNDFEKPSNINAAKEKKCKKSYDMLSLSIDDPNFNKASKSSILSPLSKDVETENLIESKNSDCKINTDQEDKMCQNIGVCKKASTPELETCFKMSSKKMERNKKKTSDPKEKNCCHRFKSIEVSKSSVDNESKKVHFEKESSTKLSGGSKTKSTRFSSKEITKPLELREMPLKNWIGESRNESNDFEKESCIKLSDGNKIKDTRKASSSSTQTDNFSELREMPLKNLKEKSDEESSNFEKGSHTKLLNVNKIKSSRKPSSSMQTVKLPKLREVPLKNVKKKSDNESNDFEKESHTKLSSGNKTNSTRRASPSIQTVKLPDAKEMPLKRLKGKIGNESNDFLKESYGNKTKSTIRASPSIQIVKPSDASEMPLKSSKGKSGNELNTVKDSHIKLSDGNKTKSNRKTPTTINAIKISEAGDMPAKSLREKNGSKDGRTIKDFQFKSQQKIKIVNTDPTTENKSLSIEKTIQVTVGAEMSTIRNFLFDQNLSMQKDLLNFQEKAQKQIEVSTYMFAVIDELLETNRKLISKCK